MTFEVIGAKLVAKELEHIDTYMEARAETAIMAAATIVEEGARAKTKGRLAASVKKLSKSGKGANLEVKVGSRWRKDGWLIGHLIEYGHGGPHPAPPKPGERGWLRSTMDENRERIQRMIASALRL